MLPRDLKVASFNVRDMAKRLTVQANAARTLPLSCILLTVLCFCAKRGICREGSTSISINLTLLNARCARIRVPRANQQAQRVHQDILQKRTSEEPEPAGTWLARADTTTQFIS